MKRHLFAVAMLLAGSAFAQQRAPEILFTSVPDYPNLPAGMNFGEVPGVAVNSRGHVFVFSRSNSANGPAFGAAAAQLFEFDQNGNFVREIGKGLYAWSEAHSVRIDRNDNIWAIDKGSNMVVRFNPQGRVVWVFGRFLLAAEHPHDAALRVEPDDHVRALVDGPDIVVPIDAHAVRLRPGIETFADLPHEVAVLIEFE